MKLAGSVGLEPPLFLAPNQVPYQVRRHAVSDMLINYLLVNFG